MVKEVLLVLLDVVAFSLVVLCIVFQSLFCFCGGSSNFLEAGQ